MGFNRVNVSASGKLLQPSRVGDGFFANVLPKIYAAETDQTITIAELSGGAILQGTTLTSDVIYTLSTAAIIAAEWPEMDIGDCFAFYVGNTQVGAFDVVIAVGVGITAIGANNTLSAPPQGGRMMFLIKTAAATFALY